MNDIKSTPESREISGKSRFSHFLSVFTLQKLSSSQTACQENDATKKTYCRALALPGFPGNFPDFIFGRNLSRQSLGDGGSNHIKP